MTKTAMANGTAISVSQLGKVYREGWIRRRGIAALVDVTFDVQSGEIFGLLGPNGAGKTTFLKILLGIISKTSGSASMLSYPAGSRQGRKQVGYLPEQLRVPWHLTGWTALDYYGSMNDLSSREIRARRDDVLELVGLRDRGRDAVRKYSKGMQQRLGLAQALLHRPRLLVLDEPTDGLDPRARAEMRDVIRQLKSDGVTVFLNSHILQEVELICDRVAILDQGRLRYCGSVKEIGKFTSAGTGKTQLQIEFELQGDEQTVRRALVDLDVRGFEAVDDRVQATVFFDEQSSVDACIDRLRAESVSLIRLAQHATTLEDAFLKIVEYQPEGQAKAGRP